jgi:hypothetical protein
MNEPCQRWRSEIQSCDPDFQVHIESCEECREQWLAHQTLSDQTTPADSSNNELSQRILAGVNKRRSDRYRKALVIAGLGALAAMIGYLGSSWLY